MDFNKVHACLELMLQTMPDLPPNLQNRILQYVSVDEIEALRVQAKTLAVHQEKLKEARELWDRFDSQSGRDMTPVNRTITDIKAAIERIIDQK